MITVNQIYDTLYNALEGVYVTKYYSRITEHLPCVYFRESHSPLASANQLDYADDQKRMYCYIEVYGYDLDEIVQKIEAAMKSMYFIEELNEMIHAQSKDHSSVSFRLVPQ